MCDVLKYSGLGWAGIKAIQGVLGKYRQPAGVTCELVGEFSDWTDDVWEKSKAHYSLIAIRSQQILNVLYPPSDSRFKRLKVMRDGKVVGWAVLLNTPMSGHKQFGDMQLGSLVDCLAKPDDAPDVVVCSRDFLAANGADLIVSNQASQAWGKALKRCGFLEGPSNFPFLAAPKLAASWIPSTKTPRPSI